MDGTQIIRQECFYETLLDNLLDGVYAVDLNRRIYYWNRGAEKLTGYSRAEVLGRSCSDNLLMHIDDAGHQMCLGSCPPARTLDDGLDRQACVFLKHRSGYRRPVKVMVAPVRDSSGVIVGAIEVFSDNNAEVQAEKTIRDLRKALLLDPLTEMSNRRSVEINLHSRLAEKRRYGRDFGVLLADIDHFKAINDRWGHEVGDAVLRMVSRTLLNASRVSDCVGRWGGEEFVCLVHCDTAAELLAAAERLRQFVSQSQFELESQTISVTISVGGLLAASECTAEMLIQAADQQMYLSKQRGRNRVTIAS